MSKNTVFATAPQISGPVTNLHCMLLQERAYQDVLDSPERTKDWIEFINAQGAEDAELYGLKHTEVTDLPTLGDLIRQYGSWGRALEALGEKRWCGFLWVLADYLDDEGNLAELPGYEEDQLKAQALYRPLLEAVAKTRIAGIWSLDDWDLVTHDPVANEAIFGLPEAEVLREAQNAIGVRVPTKFEVRHVFGDVGKDFFQGLGKADYQG